jgi:hypothetical protein
METFRWQRLLTALYRWKIAILVVFCLTLLSAPFIYRSTRLIGLPDIGEPFDVEMYGTIKITDAENAFIEYDQAAPSDDPADVEDAIRQGWSSATPTIRKWLDDNRGALELMKAGSKKPKALIGQPKDQSYRTMIAIRKNRALSQLARLEAARLQDEGDVAGSWEWYRVAFRHSRHVGMYGATINRSTGMYFHHVTSERIVGWSVDPRIDSPLLRRALENVIFDYQLTQPYSTTLRSQYFDTMNWINYLEQKEEIADIDPHDPVAPWVLFLKNEPEVGKRVIKLTYANWLSQIDLPRHRQSRVRPGDLCLFEPVAGTPLPSEPAPAEIQHIFSNSPVSAYGVGKGPPLRAFITHERTRQSQLVVALAAQLYFRDKERFPRVTAEFLDGYLSEWPIDPQSDDGKPMHYRFDPAIGEVTVWSVGPNGINDGGNIDVRWNDEHFDHGVTIHVPRE